MTKYDRFGKKQKKTSIIAVNMVHVVDRVILVTSTPAAVWSKNITNKVTLDSKLHETGHHTSESRNSGNFFASSRIPGSNKKNTFQQPTYDEIGTTSQIDRDGPRKHTNETRQNQSKISNGTPHTKEVAKNPDLKEQEQPST